MRFSFKQKFALWFHCNNNFFPELLVCFWGNTLRHVVRFFQPLKYIKTLVVGWQILGESRKSNQLQFAVSTSQYNLLMIKTKRLWSIVNVISEDGVWYRHGHLTPLMSLVPDGLYRSDRIAGKIPVKKRKTQVRLATQKFFLEYNRKDQVS